EPLLPASDGSILSAAAILTGIGIVMVYSITAPLSEGSPVPAFFVRHLEGIAGGIVCAAVAFRLPLSSWRRMALPAWGISVALLVLTQAIGVRTNGAQRWLVIPGTGVTFQPVELAKLATLLVVAQLLARNEGPSAFRPRNVVPIVAVALVPAALLVLQPDLGNAVVLLALTGALLFAAGAPLRLFVLPALIGALGVTAYVLTHAYAGARMTSFLRPWETSGREGYQLVQSFVAFGRGHVLGVGVGAGRQKLAYLPEAHTDFVLAGVAEELGLVGVLVVIGGFAALLLGGLRIARRARDRYSLLVAFAATLLLTLPAAINAAVVMGLLPTKGLAMPFLSYGRSATLACFLALGLLLGIGRREAAPLRPTVGGAERRGLLRP
ncbi:MAG TPA: putative lipid II flippase FtsW, partial [Deltaproteobacteria bacterium]|nr:putative lipid II flippase FtsW [Deltaproteobacteria bacterium]